jgi:hypothetical protein
VLAVGGRRTPKRARQIVRPGERRLGEVDATGQISPRHQWPLSAARTGPAEGRQHQRMQSMRTVEADSSRMAKAVAKQIEELMASQKWIAPEQPQSK